MSDTKTEYYFSKFALVLGTVLLIPLLLLFVIAVCGVFITDLKLAMFGCLLFCLLFLILLLEAVPRLYRRIKLYLKTTPALILTEDILIDNTNDLIYKWTDIEKFYSSSIKISWRVNFIAISLVDPYKYIDSIMNPYKRFIARTNQKYFNGAFSIQPNAIRCDNAELLNNLIQHQAKAADKTAANTIACCHSG